LRDRYTTYRGWAAYRTFGLRREWLQLYLDHPDEWEVVGGLGNRQVQSLRRWLRTAGVLDGKGRETFLADLFRERGMEEPLPWEILWVNVVFNFPTARWYVEDLAVGEWATTEIRRRLQVAVPRLAERTATNAVMELVGLLERTPVGSELCQGVVRPTRPRRVTRSGLESPSARALLYATWRLFQEKETNRLDLNEDLLWPWVVFGCEMGTVVRALVVAGDEFVEVTSTHLEVRDKTTEWGYVDLC